jgi:hypothetical protein
LDVEFNELLEQLDGHHFWLSYLSDASQPMSPVGIHLAVFAEPFLTMVFSGAKTIDSRFSRHRCAPYGEIGNGDIILLKKAGGPICGVALAGRTWFYHLVTEPLEGIRHRFGPQICADEEFWKSRADAKYATLIQLGVPASTAPVGCSKRDRRGWVSLRPRQLGFDFGLTRALASLSGSGVV